jgi:hypothetical protein
VGAITAHRITFLLRCVGRDWHMTAFAASQNLGRYRTKSGHSNRPMKEPRSTSFNLVNDRALPDHGNASVAFRVIAINGSL